MSMKEKKPSLPELRRVLQLVAAGGVKIAEKASGPSRKAA
jgi:hypothetical protein